MSIDPLKQYLEDVVGVVEANSFETTHLWSEYTMRGKSWVSTGHGYLPTVGKFNDMPVCISILSATVDGDKILFYDPTSQVVDYRLIDRWLFDNIPNARRADGYLNRTDAMNFYNVLSEAKRIKAVRAVALSSEPCDTTAN